MDMISAHQLMAELLSPGLGKEGVFCFVLFWGRSKDKKNYYFFRIRGSFFLRFKATGRFTTVINKPKSASVSSEIKKISNIHRNLGKSVKQQVFI